MSGLSAHLAQYDVPVWRSAVETLAQEVHPVDAAALRIWFTFFPLELHLALEQADDPALAERQLGLMGKWRLADQVDESHRFFFAHRYWPQVKAAIQSFDEPAPDDLVALVRLVAETAARTARVDREFLLGISASGLMTLRQAGMDAFAAAPGAVHLSSGVRARSPHQVLKRRRRHDSQGVVGFLRGIKKRWTVTFDENEPDATFIAIHGQEMASAAQSDRRDHHVRDSRCTVGEGPIPVECRAASCGTCWVGVLAGSENLSPVSDRDERRRMQVFGYIDSADPHPIIRLACQARVEGTVSVVIPPWNGFIASCRRCP